MLREYFFVHGIPSMSRIWFQKLRVRGEKRCAAAMAARKALRPIASRSMNAPLHAVDIEPGTFPSSLAELIDEYGTHAVRGRGVHERRRDAERLYLRRFFDWFDSPDSSVELVSRINADSVTQCCSAPRRVV